MAYVLLDSVGIVVSVGIFCWLRFFQCVKTLNFPFLCYLWGMPWCDTGQTRKLQSSCTPQFLPRKKTDFFEGYCKTLLSFPESSFSMLGKTDSFRAATWGSCCVDNARFLGFHCTGWCMTGSVSCFMIIPVYLGSTIPCIQQVARTFNW